MASVNTKKQKSFKYFSNQLIKRKNKNTVQIQIIIAGNISHINDYFQIQIVTGSSLKIFDQKNYLSVNFFLSRIGIFTKYLIIFFHDGSKSFIK